MSTYSKLNICLKLIDSRFSNDAINLAIIMKFIALVGDIFERTKFDDPRHLATMITSTWKWILRLTCESIANDTDAVLLHGRGKLQSFDAKMWNSKQVTMSWAKLGYDWVPTGGGLARKSADRSPRGRIPRMRRVTSMATPHHPPSKIN